MTDNTNEQLRELAEWAATVTIDDVPAEVVTQAQWCVLDLLGVTVAASADDSLQRLIAAERTLDDSQQARVLVHGDRFSVPVAARINAFAASVTELADNVSVHANEANIPLALAHAEARGCGEALLATTTGLLSEATGSNVFVVLGGRLVTPPLSSGCLPGVTRALVLELTDAVEEDVPMAALAEADEVFLTSTTRRVQAVHELDGRPLHPAPGPVTAAVRDALEDLVRRTAEP